MPENRVANPPPTPKGLARTPGGRLWRDVATVYGLRPDELRILEDACRTLNETRRLERALSRSSVTVKGSKGQVRAHPLLAEIHHSRRLLAGLLKQLALPNEPDDEEESPATLQARKAANARWGKKAEFERLRRDGVA